MLLNTKKWGNMCSARVMPPFRLVLVFKQFRPKYVKYVAGFNYDAEVEMVFGMFRLLLELKWGLIALNSIFQYSILWLCNKYANMAW